VEKGFVEEDENPYFLEAIRKIEHTLVDQKELIIQSTVWTVWTDEFKA